MIVTLGGSKGGVGKSNLATSFAAMRALLGRDVLLLDTDKQRTASKWHALRSEGGITPKVNAIEKQGKEVRSAVMDLAERYDDIVIDVGGRESVELGAALLVSEVAIFPLQPSQFDLWTLEEMVPLIDNAMALNPELKPLMVISRASPNPLISEINEAREVLKDIPNLCLAQTVIRERQSFRKAVREGRSVLEMPEGSRDAKAVSELCWLYEEIYGEQYSAQGAAAA